MRVSKPLRELYDQNAVPLILAFGALSLGSSVTFLFLVTR
jgi:hypothetical protein